MCTTSLVGLLPRNRFDLACPMFFVAIREDMAYVQPIPLFVRDVAVLEGGVDSLAKKVLRE